MRAVDGWPLESCRVGALFETLWRDAPRRGFIASATYVCVRSLRRDVTTAGRVCFPLSGVTFFRDLNMVIQSGHSTKLTRSA